MRGELRCVVVLAVAAVLSAVPSAAGAQVHWDAGVQAGATERAGVGGDAARSPGPSAEVHAHVAVYPLVRVGPYFAFDLSPTAGEPDREAYAAGVRVKLTPPWLSAPWRAWAFLGLGYAYLTIPPLGVSTSTAEVPVGFGVGHKLSGPWDLYAELEARVDASGIGGDLLAVSVSVGVSFQP